MTEKKDCNCSSACSCIAKFFVVALGTFVGMFCAMCAFTTLSHTPQFNKQFAFQTVSVKGVNQKVEKKHVKVEKTQKVDKEHKDAKPVEK